MIVQTLFVFGLTELAFAGYVLFTHAETTAVMSAALCITTVEASIVFAWLIALITTPQQPALALWLVAVFAAFNPLLALIYRRHSIK